MDVQGLNEAIKPTLMEQITIIKAISLGGRMLTIECTCYFKGLPVCGNREIIKDGGLT